MSIGNIQIGKGMVRQARGFSLVEIMVALTLSLLLLAGVLSIFASSRASYETNDKLARIQESGRFALDLITHDIRAAGFVGCARVPTYLSTSLHNSTVLQWNFLEGPVRGFQSVSAGIWSPGLDASVTSPANGSDVLVVRVPKPDSTPLRVVADMGTSTDPLTVPNTSTSGLAANDVAMAYSCEAQSVFFVTGFAGGEIEHAASAGPGANSAIGNSTDDLSYRFRENAEVLPIQTIVYYIRQSTAAASGTAPADQTSLWRRVALNAPEELVEGVQQMQLQFGLDTTGDSIVDSYVNANTVGTNWDDVYSVRVALLQRSLEQYGSDTDLGSYNLLDVNVNAPGDRYLRQVFTTTASIRNRVPVN